MRLAGPPPRSRPRELHASFERRLFAGGPDATTPVHVAPRGGWDSSADDRAAADLTVWIAEASPPGGGGEELLYLRHNGRVEPAEDAFRRAVLRGERSVVTEALLRGDGTITPVERTVSGARPYSVTLSRDKALWKIAELVCRAAARAQAARVHPPAGHATPDEPPSRAPTTAELIARSPWRWLRIVTMRALFTRAWEVRVRVAGPRPSAGWTPTPPSPVAWRRGHLYADPFLFEHRGRHHLFCEELLPGANRAVISHVALQPGSVAGPPEPVLQEPHHLSYPFVFAHDGEVFLIPETSAEQRVELYRAVDFPRSWRSEAVLLEGLVASDATLLAHEGRLWLFVCVAVPHAAMVDELHLFSAPAPAGPWEPHPLNPVVSDVRGARPAGAIQRWGTALVRPAQDCELRYGGAVSFRQIDVLDTEDYSEREVARLDPAALGGAVRATHTYASDGLFEAVDLRERRLRWRLELPLRARGGG